jgi:nucleoside 2-deoxyribosyltransferase
VKVYITARYKGTENKESIEALCAAVRDAGLKDFCFVRDVEHYKHVFDNSKELWAKTYDELAACDMLLIDVSDYPTGGRLIETGMAYALKIPIVVIKKPGTEYKEFFDGVSEKVIEYDSYKDLSHQLKKFDHDRSFNVTDKSAMLIMFLLLGGVIGWLAAQIFILLAAAVVTIYWFIVRHFFASMRAFDRVVIYIPLALIWLGGFYVLQHADISFVLAWTIIYWFVALLLLKKMKFSL